jgi:hypothetical protein
MARRKKSEETFDSGHPCGWAGCRAAGNFKAPRYRDKPGDYQWFCEEHISEFNKNWDYFQGMSQEDIYAFQKDAHLGGARPTWDINQQAANLHQKMNEAYARMFVGNKAARAAFIDIPVTAKARDALAVMDLEHPSDKKAIKSQYRELVKKYHPDVNVGNARAEDTFKKITLAYQYLMEHYVEDVK